MIYYQKTNNRIRDKVQVVVDLSRYATKNN